MAEMDPIDQAEADYAPYRKRMVEGWEDWRALVRERGGVPMQLAPESGELVTGHAGPPGPGQVVAPQWAITDPSLPKYPHSTPIINKGAWENKWPGSYASWQETEDWHQTLKKKRKLGTEGFVSYRERPGAQSMPLPWESDQSEMTPQQVREIMMEQMRMRRRGVGHLTQEIMQQQSLPPGEY